MTRCSVFCDDLTTYKEPLLFVKRRFVLGGSELTEPFFWGMTLKAAGSMRFRWNEENPLRDKMLSELCRGRQPLPVQLDHTKIVIAAKSLDDTFGKIADGVITKNETLVPVVTVADCMPIFLCDPVSGFFGVVHSGWKGTGIAAEAVRLAVSEYGAEQKNICAVLGPHIRNCCYVVNKERADYFAKNFGKDCVMPYTGPAVNWNTGGGELFSLSLEKANLFVLKNAGVPDQNILCTTDCTCCNPIFGSNRRQTQAAEPFTVQAAFCTKE